jgi:hypothetical protein
LFSITIRNTDVPWDEGAVVGDVGLSDGAAGEIGRVLGVERPAVGVAGAHEAMNSITPRTPARPAAIFNGR